MTISGTINRVNQDGNGSTVNIPIPSTMPFQAPGDLVVIETVIATGVQTAKMLTTDYTVTGTPDALGYYSSGGTVVANTAFPSTVRWTVYRDTPRTQVLDLTENNSLPAESVEASLDRLTMLVQRVADQIGRSLRQPEGDEAAIAQIPSKVDRASKYSAYDADGDPITTIGTTEANPVSTFMATVLDDTTAAAAITTLGIVPFDWTPVLTFDTPGDLSVTYALRQGKGVKIGPFVWLSAEVLSGTNAFTFTTSTGRLKVDGSPYTPGGTYNGSIGTALIVGDVDAAHVQGFASETLANGSIAFVANLPGTYTQVNSGDFSSGSTVWTKFSIAFFTDS